MTMQIEVRGNKKFDDVNQNNINQGDVNRWITVQDPSNNIYSNFPVHEKIVSKLLSASLAVIGQPAIIVARVGR